MFLTNCWNFRIPFIFPVCICWLLRRIVANVVQSLRGVWIDRGSWERMTHDLDILTWGTLVVSVFLIRCTSLTLRFDLQVNLLNALLLCPSWSSWMLPFRRRTDDGFFSNSPLTAPLVKVKDSRVHVSFDNEVVLPTIEAKDLLWNFNDDDKIVEPCYTFLLTSRCRVTPMKLDRLLWITITNGLNCHLNCRRFFCFASG